MTRKRGGIENRGGTINSHGGHVVGGNLYLTIIRQGATVEDIFDALETRRGTLQTVETAHMQQHQVIALAQRIIPKKSLTFNQAIAVLEHAVDIAVSVKQHGLDVKGEDEFIDAIVAEVADDDKFTADRLAQQLRFSWFGMVLRFSSPQIAILYNMMKADPKTSMATIVSVLLSKDIPASAAVTITSAIFALGPAELKQADSGSNGIAMSIPWVGPAWCRSL
jgi:hypothetical protein